MTYKCLVVDVDDTLINDTFVIPERTKKALIDFQEKGYQLVLASGRPMEGMLEEARELLLDKYGSYVISFNGATITKMDSMERLFEKHLEMEDQEALLTFFKENNLATLTYHNGKIIIDHENVHTHVESELTGMPMEYDATFFEELTQPMLKFIGVGDEKIVKQLEAELGGQFGQSCNAVTSKPFYLEVFHKDVSKGQTLEHLAEILDIDMEEIVAVGDGNNDISMIQQAGVGIAVENATPELKAVSDDITGSNNDEGLLQVLEKYFNLSNQ
ncbi:HAD family hydrolase [Aerococcaceae bacterium DSM 111020]|nr:HAD family hydrolase [Aerococcaceae bacterium DSM 111020]